jgi:DNA-binding FrmR family transcriptional regulator
MKDDFSMHTHEHDEMHRQGIPHDHNHEHVHGHPHTHTHENTKAVLNRLSRAIGHLQSVRRMVEDGRDCTEVLIQVAAVRSAIDNTGKVILQDHIKHCILDAALEGDQQAIDDLCKAIDKYIK